MVDELCNPVNYEFSGGDVTKGDYIDKLTTNSHIVIPNIESTKAACTKSKELGLFNLFFTDLLRQSIMRWKSADYSRSGTNNTYKNDLDVF